MSDIEARQALLEPIYEAFNRRDIDAILENLHPDVDWPNVLAGERLHGRDALRAYWLDQFKLIRSEVAPLRFTALPDGRTQVLVDQVVRNLDGRLWSEGQVVQTYSFDPGGRITRMDVADVA
jgi:ketosteroid isomerase-like protein